jgi:cardiolipin synthase
VGSSGATTGPGDEGSGGVERGDGPGPVAPTGRTTRVLTVPNALSVGRLLCVPVFLWLLFGRDNRAGAAVLLAFLGATDWVDGSIARRFDQVSTLGKVLDPVADRVLLIVGVGAIVVDGSVPLVVAVLVLAREGVIAVGTVAIAAMGARRVDVTWAGKAGTFGLMFAFPLFLAGESGLWWADGCRVLAWIAVVPALWFSYRSAFGYLPLARAALRGGRVPPGEGLGSER